MAPAPAIARQATYAGYLALQAEHPERLTWVRGEVFAMAGGSVAHARLIAQIGGELYAALRGSPCRAVVAEQRVRILEADASIYPDIAVICGPDELAPDDPDALVNPTVLVEVLSPSTEAWDRGGRFHLVQALACVRHYVLVSQDRRLIERFDRNADGTWAVRNHIGSDEVELPAVGASLALDAVYAGVLDPETP